MKKFYLLFFSFSMVFPLMWAGNAPDTIVDCDETTNYLYWVGNVDDDFWNEANWRITNQKPSRANSAQDGLERSYCLPGANKESFQICLGNQDPDRDRVPGDGIMEPGGAIRYNLFIENAIIEISGNVLFSCDNKGITSFNSEIKVINQLLNGVVSLDAESTVVFNSEQQSHEGVKYNLLDAQSWIYFHLNNPNQLLANATQSLYRENSVAELSEIRLDQYYQKGAIYRQESQDYTPLTIFGGSNNSGDSAALNYYDVFQGGSIPEGMNNSMSSFTLKRGFQATFAIEENGTSMSKVYIASEEDLIIDDLPAALNNNISFIRVMPWEWIVKKGTGGYNNGLNAGWYYNWGNSSNSEPNYHYEPMSWGAGGSRPDAIARIMEKEEVNHLLGFNESDNCNDQSGQFNNLCEPEVAVAYYENLMGTGLRLGTPAPRENGPFGWLNEFAIIAKERNVRFDFVAVHWYDWGSNPAKTPNAPANEIFNRFKNYLERVHSRYNLPIWITEFNANPNRGNATQDEFLRLALPYLESLDYVERYAYFEPNPNNSSSPNEPSYYFDENGNLTNIGEIYLNQNSTPSIPELTYEAPNNLEGLDQPFEEKEPNVIAFEAECSPYLGNQTDLVEDEEASNNYYLKLNKEKVGAKDLAKQIHFEFNLDQADTYRIWVRYKSSTGTNTLIRAFLNDSEEFDALGGLNSDTFRWEQLPRFYDLEEGKHRITIELANDRFLFDAMALISNSGSVDLIPSAAETCTPPDDRWGANDTDITYFKEAESANPLGTAWNIGNSGKAIGGEYIESSLSSIETPPDDSGYAIFNFNIEESDEYEIWGKVQALSENTDAFWVKVNDGEFMKWDNLESNAFLWYWVEFHSTVGEMDRGQSYFLEAGQHTVTIAYNEANTKIDRIAISSADRSPSEEDPNVLIPNIDLEYEAEDALLIGNHRVANCAQASNGQIVRPNRARSNIIRFENVAVVEPGTYTLKVSYLSATTRPFGMVVNNENLGDQQVVSSGAWCFGGGETAIHEVEVELKAGENLIDITGAGADAPFIDKIAIASSAEIYGMEAEFAILNGNTEVQNCDAASNGQYVNTYEWTGNSIEFQNIEVDAEGSFNLKIDYVSGNDRVMNLIVNGNEVGSLQFPSSGPWCFNGGVPAILTYSIDLNMGLNNIILVNAGERAPLIDKISLEAVDGSVATQSWEALAVEQDSFTNEDIKIAPNPVNSGDEISISLPDEFDTNFTIRIFDHNGRLIYSDSLVKAEKVVIFNPSLRTGQYVISISNSKQKTFTKHLLVR